MLAIKCSSLKVTHVTSVQSPLVRTSHLAASNHRGPGSASQEVHAPEVQRTRKIWQIALMMTTRYLA